MSKRLVTIYIVAEDEREPGGYVLASSPALRVEDRTGVRYVLQGGPHRAFYGRKSIRSYDGVSETPVGAVQWKRKRLQERLAYALREYHANKTKLEAFKRWSPLRVVKGEAS
jgi:hypothetical protein